MRLRKFNNVYEALEKATAEGVAKVVAFWGDGQYSFHLAPGSALKATRARREAEGEPAWFVKRKTYASAGYQEWSWYEARLKREPKMNGPGPIHVCLSNRACIFQRI